MKPHTPLDAAIRAILPGLVGVAVFSFCVNLLMFTTPLYMLQVFERVLSTRSVETLLALTAIALFLLFVYQALEVVRSRVLVRMGTRFDEEIGGFLLTGAFRDSVKHRSLDSYAVLRDLRQVRDFVAGPPMIAFFDAPWFPLFIAFLWILHPWFGTLAIVAGLFLVAISVLNYLASRSVVQAASKFASRADLTLLSAQRNAEAIAAMGMFPSLRSRWRDLSRGAAGWQALGSDRAGLFVALSKTTRLVVQMGTLGLGAYLAIRQEISPGAIFAANIVIGRAMMPVESVVQNWRSFLVAREGYARIVELARTSAVEGPRISLPRPQGRLSLEKVFALPTKGGRAVISNVSFTVEPGRVLGIIGASGAGKSTLVRVLLGLVAPAAGHVRLDGSDLSHFDPDALGRYFGYVPQDVELFDATIAENIARLGTVDDEAVVEAARLAGVHELIQSLPDGYDTPVGAGGFALSGGQRQRISIARAIFGDPCLVVMDEPNSNLDGRGEDALVSTIGALRAKGTTVIVVTHKPGLLACADDVLFLENGSVRLFGERDKVLSEIMGPRLVAARPAPPSLAS